MVGREALREACASIFEMFRDFTPEPHRVIYGDRHWVLEWPLRATTSAEHGGKQVEKRVSVDCLDVVIVSEDGLVARKTHTWTSPNSTRCSAHPDHLGAAVDHRPASGVSERQFCRSRPSRDMVVPLT